MQWATRTHQRFAGVAIDELLVIEICAGSARLTKTCRKLGIRGLAVDKITSRSCGIDIMTLDLTVPSLTSSRQNEIDCSWSLLHHLAEQPAGLEGGP